MIKKAIRDVRKRSDLPRGELSCLTHELDHNLGQVHKSFEPMGGTCWIIFKTKIVIDAAFKI